jgi:hypothetical protein
MGLDNKSSTSSIDPSKPDIVEEDNEIKRYVDARYVSSIEACWRIFGFPLHEQYPTTKRLQCHLEDQQNIRFNDDDKLIDVIKDVKYTQLTHFFKLNDEGKDLDCNNLKYHEMPKYYTWNGKQWKKRAK